MTEINIDLAQIRKNGIYLMVPAYAGQCFAAFTRSMMQLSALCAQHGIPLDTFFIYNESLITRARNYCADEFLRRTFKLQHDDGSITEHHFQHGLFIDTDIEFDPIDILVMAHMQNTNPELDVVCGPYPKKQISMEKLREAVNKGFGDEDPDNLFNFIGDYVFNAPNNKPISLGAPAEVYESGTGFMMFRRDTLLKIKEVFTDISYRPDHVRTANFDGSREICSFFDTSIDEETKRYLSEDYHFCKLVRKSGMKVWILPWIKLKHHGYFVYGGSLEALAAAGLTATTDTSKIRKK